LERSPGAGASRSLAEIGHERRKGGAATGCDAKKQVSNVVD
jgi:hypothetical protein